MVGLVVFLTLILPVASASGKPLDLGIGNTGISVGNSHTWRGLRLNLIDGNVNRISGVSISAGGTQAVEGLSGVNIGGIAEVADAPGHGDHGSIRGVTFGGIAVVSSGSVSGLSASFGGVFAGGPLSGVAVAGVFGAGGRVTGIVVSGIVSEAGALRGAGLAGWEVHAADLRGVGVASYVHAERAAGLVIAIFNRVETLEGLEVGVLNHAGNNHGWRRWLPLLNAHF